MFILKQGADGMPVAEICRKAGISQATCFNWKKRYDGLLPTEMRRLKQREDENSKLGKLVADLSLDKEMLQDVIRRRHQPSGGMAGRRWLRVPLSPVEAQPYLTAESGAKLLSYSSGDSGLHGSRLFSGELRLWPMAPQAQQNARKQCLSGAWDCQHGLPFSRSD